MVQQFVAAHVEHGFVDVCQHHATRGSDDVSELCGQVTRAAGNIQHRLAGAHGTEFDGEALPYPVYAAGHEVIHQVIAPRHRMKDIGHEAGLGVLIDFPVTEMGGAFIAHAASAVL